jgi:CHAD domain-containing protein
VHLSTDRFLMPEPITTFLHYSLVLKTALADCRSATQPKAVHRFRSTTRRMEGTLELLIATAELPSLPKKFKAFRRSFRRVRRATGRVRDLDVHRELLVAYEAISDAVLLEADLDVARKKAAKKLRQRFAEDEHGLRRALDQLETTLTPKVDLNLSGEGIADVAQSWLATAIHGLDLQSDDDLHSIRKACKTARYIAEIGGEADQTAKNLAKHFDNVQHAIGAWHDCLLLFDRVHQTLSEDSPLAQRLAAKAERLRQRAEAKAARLLPA